MIAEFLREAALLVAFFIPLDLAIADRQLTWLWVIAMIIVPVSLLTAGIWLERIRGK